MAPPKDPPVLRNLQATADLLDALQNDPSLLNDEEFIKRLSILRQKHEETTNFLAKKLGAPPLPTMMTSSEITQHRSSYKVTKSSSCHFQDEASPSDYQMPRHLDLKPRSSEVRVPVRAAPEPPREQSWSQTEYATLAHNQSHEALYEDPRHQVHATSSHQNPRHQSSRHHNIESTAPSQVSVTSSVQSVAALSGQNPRQQVHATPSHQIPRHQSSRTHQNSRQQVPSATSSTLQNPRHRTSSASRHHSTRNATSATVRQILANASTRHLSSAPHIATSVAMPSGLLLSSSNTKHVASSKSENPQFATSSHVVEESFLEDGMSTTREVPTIRDEVVAGDLKLSKNRSKSMHQLSKYTPQVTVPKPFQLSLRKSTGNTYAKKFMSGLITEKQKLEEDAKKALENTKFRAKPVPKSTYQPTNTFATEQKYVEAMRKKVAAKARRKFEVQNEMVRSKSEGNLASIKPLGYVPPSTYISPIPVKPNARSRSATMRATILIQEATTPKGIKSHRAQSNLTHHLRHGRCTMDASAVSLHRRTSPPDFEKIHAKITDNFRNTNSKPSTVPIPFKFASRSKSATSRHGNCQEQAPKPFKKSTENLPKTSKNRVPSTHATQLREELNRAKIELKKSEKSGKNGNFWAEDNKQRISSFLGARSKTEEDIAMRTKQKLQQQQETTQEYMRQLAEMKQRVLNGPLIMEKQTALAQEHRLKRKFEERMKSAKGRGIERVQSQEKQQSIGRRSSEVSGSGTFVVDKGYEESFESEDKSEKSGSSTPSESGSGSESENESRSSRSSKPKSSKSTSSKSSSSRSTSSSSEA